MVIFGIQILLQRFFSLAYLFLYWSSFYAQYLCVHVCKCLCHGVGCMRIKQKKQKKVQVILHFCQFFVLVPEN